MECRTFYREAMEFLLIS